MPHFRQRSPSLQIVRGGGAGRGGGSCVGEGLAQEAVPSPLSLPAPCLGRSGCMGSQLPSSGQPRGVDAVPAASSSFAMAHLSDCSRRVYVSLSGSFYFTF